MTVIISAAIAATNASTNVSTIAVGTAGIQQDWRRPHRRTVGDRIVDAILLCTAIALVAFAAGIAWVELAS